MYIVCPISQDNRYENQLYVLRPDTSRDSDEVRTCICTYTHMHTHYYIDVQRRCTCTCMCIIHVHVHVYAGIQYMYMYMYILSAACVCFTLYMFMQNSRCTCTLYMTATHINSLLDCCRHLQICRPVLLYSVILSKWHSFQKALTSAKQYHTVLCDTAWLKLRFSACKCL